MQTSKNPRQTSATPVTVAPASGPGICFAEWLRRLLQTDGAARRQVMEEVRLEKTKREMSSVLERFMLRMSRRDMQLYLRILAAEKCDALRGLRFEYFDLLCHMASEVQAMEFLIDLDALLEQ